MNRVIEFDISVESTLFTNESISIDEYEMGCSFEYPARVEAGRMAVEQVGGYIRRVFQRRGFSVAMLLA
jgi:hypothetical protein